MSFLRATDPAAIRSAFSCIRPPHRDRPARALITGFGADGALIAHGAPSLSAEHWRWLPASGDSRREASSHRGRALGGPQQSASLPLRQRARRRGGGAARAEKCSRGTPRLVTTAAPGTQRPRRPGWRGLVLSSRSEPVAAYARRSATPGTPANNAGRPRYLAAGPSNQLCADFRRQMVPLAGLLGSAVDERPVVEVRLGQDVALLLVLQHVGPRLAIALFEQDVLRAHDVAGAEVLRIGPRPQLHVRVLGSPGGDHHRGAFVLHVGQQAA